ncbi:MAG: ACT domain-containing protein, partial [Gemmatimonadota bacterium]|nr:ACT domain-containing protein [Gemmatimonadota bacterium]
MPSRPSASPLDLTLTVLTAPLALCRFSATEPIPGWTALTRAFLTISRTPAELSIVADEAVVPASVQAHRGYRALRVEGPLPLELVGIAAAIAGVLAAASVPIIPIGTYDTDYVLVQGDVLSRAVAALESAGHRVAREDSSPGSG